MDSQLVQENNVLIKTLLSEISLLKANSHNIRELISENLNISQKVYLDDEDMLGMFGLSYHVIYKLVKSGVIKQYKLGGKSSRSYYKYDQVLDQMEKGLVKPTK